MKLLVTTHAQMFEAPDGSVWTDSVYGYDFFLRYLDVFNNIRLVTRIKTITEKETSGKIRVDGKNIEIFKLPFYHGPWEYAMKYGKIDKLLDESVEGCDSAILRIPDQKAFQLFDKIRKKKIPCGVEVVAHSWDLYAPGNIKTILRPFLRYYWDLKQKQLCKNANGVAYVTEKYIQKRYPSQVNKDARCYETSYTSANISKEFFKGPRLAEEFDIRCIRLIHISTISNFAKGHKEILLALRKLKDQGLNFNMKFVGGGTLIEHFMKMRDEFGLHNEVQFTGNISSQFEIIEALNQSDIFVFPSLTEGLPRVIIEAMASGLPCIATDVGGISELIPVECLIQPKSIKELEDKICSFSQKPDFLARLSAENFNKAVKLYLPEVTQKKRKKFYQWLKDEAVIWREKY